jgi:hypothetical protein
MEDACFDLAFIKFLKYLRFLTLCCLILFRITALMLFVLLAGCTYAPDADQVFFKNIPINENPEVKISLKDYDNESTINIYGPSTFVYDYESDFGRLEQIQIILNGNVLETSSTSSGSFSVNGNYLVNGTYELKLIVQATSNTGSIADRLNLEKFVVWRTWQLNIDITPPPQPEIFISEENGLLKLSWTPFTKSSFQYYSIKVFNNYAVSMEYKITDPYTTSMQIPIYVGGYSIECRVAIVTTLHFVESQPKSRIDQVALTGGYRFYDSTILLTWSKADFPGNFLSYSIFENRNEIKTIYTVQDTVFRLKPDVTFGESLFYYIIVNALNGFSPTSNNIYQDKLVETPVLSPMPNYFSFNKTTQSVLGYFNSINPPQATQYSNSLVPIKTISGGERSFFTSYESPYFYLTDYDHGIVQLNLETQERKYIDILPLTDGYYTSHYVKSASHNQIVTFGYKTYNSAGGDVKQHVRVYDMANQVTLYHDVSPSLGNEWIPTISEDGKYLRMAFNSFYKINGTNLQFVGQPVSNYEFLGFRQDASTEFMLRFNNVVYIYDSETTQFKRAINPPDFNFEYRGYDPATKRILYAKSNAKICYVIHAESGLATSIKAFTSDATRFHFINGYLFYEDRPYNGSYIKIITE